MTSQRKLGIIAGGGSIPKMLIEHCAAQGRDFFVLAIEGNADKALITDDIPHQWIRIGQAGTGFKRFAEEKVQDVIMIGTIKRPGFFDLVPDLRTTAFFAKVGAKALGDDGILRALVNEIEAEGMTVRGIHEVMSDLLVKPGILGRHKPDKQALVDIRRGIDDIRFTVCRGQSLQHFGQHHRKMSFVIGVHLLVLRRAFEGWAFFEDFGTDAGFFFFPVFRVPNLEFAALADKNGAVFDAGMLKQFFAQHNPPCRIKGISFCIAENQVGQVVLFLRKKVERSFNVCGQLVQQVFQASFNTGSAEASVAYNLA